MQELVKTQVDFDNLGNDDPQVAYLIGAWTRICKILGKDFEQYLPIVMGPVLKAAAFKPEVTVLADEDTEVDEDENWEVLNVGDQVRIDLLPRSSMIMRVLFDFQGLRNQNNRFRRESKCLFNVSLLRKGIERRFC